jgi:PAS domain S-box-containing protein
MKPSFHELVEIDELQSLCEIFSKLTGFVAAILDMEGNVLVATGWQEICTEFHRKNQETAEACRKSDTILGELPSPGAKYRVYRCNNGLIDVSVPITVENQQIGRLYTGQFLFAPPDMESFRHQAARYGFDETSYLEAVQKVPIVTEEQVAQVMEFLCRLAEMIGRMGLGNQRLREANEELRKNRQEMERRVEVRTAELSLKNEQLRMEIEERRHAEEALRFTQFAIDKTIDQAFWMTEDGRFFYVNDAACRALGYAREELIGMSVPDIGPTVPPEVFAAHWRDLQENGSVTLETLHRAKDGRVYPVEIRANYVVFDGREYNCAFATDITERKRSEETLRQANLVVENSPVVLFRWRAAEGWPVELVSRNVTQFGYTPEEFLSGALPFASIIHHRDLERVVAEVKENSTQGVDNFQQEYRIVKKNGELCWVYDRTVIERDAGGKITHYQGIIIDITERKRMEQDLLLTKYCVDNAGIAIYHDSEQHIYNANDFACKSLGYTVEELRAMSVFDIDPVITMEELRKISRLLETNGSATHQSMHRRRDGSTFPVEITTNIVEFQGRRYGVSFVKDITERKQAEEALRDSEEKFRVLAETSPAAIILHQGERFIYTNPATTMISGYSEAELLEMNFWEWCSDEYREIIQKRSHARIKCEAEPPQYEHKLFTKSGEGRWVIVSAGVTEYRGRPTVIATLLDITPAKEAEEKIRASLVEKEVLLKEVHHRVKNNLQIISTLLELQSESIGDKEALRAFRESQDRIKAMALIHEKLYESKDIVFIDFRRYIEELSAHLFDSYLIDPGRVLLKMECGDISIGIDRAIPCGLIINELVSNALKHAFPDARKGEISIRLHSCDDGLVKITVTDNGIGLPPGVDFRDTETLGLQLVNMLTRQLAGGIELQNESGASFTISFMATPGG